MSRIIVAIDDREKDGMDSICPLFDNMPTRSYNKSLHMPIVCRKTRVTVGDYAIIHSTGKSEQVIMSIERKTWKDLAASVKDGRIENIQKQVELARETGSRIGYIVQGPVFPNRRRKISRITTYSMVAYLDQISLKYGVNVYFAPTAEDVVRRVYELACSCISLLHKKFDFAEIPEIRDIFEDAPVVAGAEATEHELVKISMEGIPKELTMVTPRTDTQTVEEMWLSLPGVTRNNLNIFGHYTIREFVTGKVTKEAILRLKNENGTRLLETWVDLMLLVTRQEKKVTIKMTRDIRKAEMKIMSAVPGISVARAKLITAKFTLRAICEGKVTVAQMNTAAEAKKNMTNVLDRFMELLDYRIIPQS